MRWLAGAWIGLVGLTLFISGLRDGNGFLIVLACLNFVIGAYLALSPSVYFFAKHQQERRSWLHAIAIAAVFILLFVSISLGTMGFSAYRTQLESEAREFAGEAFTRIFSQHDAYYFLDHVAPHLMQEAGGRDRTTAFLQSATLYAGDVHDIQKATGRLKVTYQFPSTFNYVGVMTSEASGTRGAIQLNLIIMGSTSDWQIQNIWWQYR